MIVKGLIIFLIGFILVFCLFMTFFLIGYFDKKKEINDKK